jgi:hypothetical protein
MDLDTLITQLIDLRAEHGNLNVMVPAGDEFIKITNLFIDGVEHHGGGTYQIVPLNGEKTLLIE